MCNTEIHLMFTSQNMRLFVGLTTCIHQGNLTLTQLQLSDTKLVQICNIIVTLVIVIQQFWLEVLHACEEPIAVILNMAYQQQYYCIGVLNQTRTSRRSACAWFLEIGLVHDVSVCLTPKLVITSDIIQTPYDQFNKFCSLYMAAIVDIISWRGLTIEVHHRNQPNKSKPALCKP